ncbi:MAG: hypothetical protein LBK76_05025 [Verrucomicrobiales bacterium]|jgi:hypothetical protein|nr:hypothetical protein [Verrucomicrobiales bacterium]
MKAIKKEKNFDCLAMKRDLQAKIYAETSNMSFDEFHAYLARRLKNSPFVRRLAAHMVG